MFEFAGVILIFVSALAVLTTRHHGCRWWTTKSGRGVAFGLFLAPLAALAIGMLGGCSTVDVYAGLESTKNLSPQCETGGANDKLTRNLGVEACRIVSADGRTRLCGVYRHHSCAISEDRESYDAFGLSVTRRIWSVE